MTEVRTDLNANLACTMTSSNHQQKLGDHLYNQMGFLE
jgi:hypothetical protein